MSIRILLLVLAFWPACAMSDTWVPITSEIPGVQLWGLRTADDNTFPFEVYEGEDNEFMPHCNSGQHIYISTLEAPVKCHFKNAGGFYRIQVETKDKRVTGRLVVVSKRPIPPKVKAHAFTLEEIKKLKRAERISATAHDNKVKRQFAANNNNSTEKDSVEYVRTIKSSKQYRRYIGARFKLPAPNGYIYISSIGLDSSEYIGWELINVVFREIDGQMTEVGAFAGCIQGGFRDLNSDGTPEVLTSTCENSESSSDSYWSLVPEVKAVLGH